MTRWANRSRSLATGRDGQGRAHLAHPRGRETAEPADQLRAVDALDVIEADRGVVIEPFVRADDDLAGAGFRFIYIFVTSGNFVKRLDSNDLINAP